MTRSSGVAEVVAEFLEVALASNRLRSDRHLTLHGEDAFFGVYGTQITTGIKLGDAGAVMIAPAADVSTLVLLGLRGNRIGVQGIQALQGSLNCSTSLTCLQLDGDPLGDHGATVLADVLKQNKSLTHVGLCRCNLHIAGLTALAEAVRVNTRLQCLGHYVPNLNTLSRPVTCKARSLIKREICDELRSRGLDSEGPKDVLAAQLQVELDASLAPVALIRRSLARNKRIGRKPRSSSRL